MVRKATKSLLVATNNPHKFKEISHILSDLPLRLLALWEFPHIPEVEETGTRFEDNALLKAREIHKRTGLFCIADDSGLEVDALKGAPGIFSARFAGEEKDSARNNEKLLKMLETVADDQRRARFRCVVALVGPQFERLVEGEVRGRIAHQLRGTGGFGYDPLFIPEGYTQTFAQLSPEIKNKISHRALAFQKAAKLLQDLLKKGVL